MIDSQTEAVALRAVTKRYGTITALDAINLAIPQGQTIAILGPNGAGKTTAVSLMLGLRAPTSGAVEVLGGNPRDVRTRTAMGAMLQTSGVPAYLRVGEAIELFRTYYPKPMPFAKIVDTCNLADKLKATVTSLSGGELQRLYFALAICGDPQIVLLDEPTVGLDVEARRAFLATIKSIGKSGRTVVLTTHYLEEADALADRIVVVDRGTIVADGTPAQIKSTVSRKHVRFKSTQALESASFATLAGVAIAREGDTYTAVMEHPEAFLAELFGRNVPLCDLTITGASLEEAFLTITAREEQHVA